MAIDPSRANLVVNEFRFLQSPSSTVGAAILAKFPKARIITIEANTDQAGAQALADEISTMTSSLVKVFTFGVEGVMYPDDFLGGFPRYVLVFPRHGGIGSNPYTVVAAEVDYVKGITTLTVRGS